MLETVKSPEIRKGVRVIRHYNDDEALKYKALTRERAQRDEASYIEEATLNGIEIGMKKGEAKGRAEGKAEGEARGMVFAIKNLMKSMKMGVDEAMNILGIPDESREVCGALAMA